MGLLDRFRSDEWHEKNNKNNLGNLKEVKILEQVGFAKAVVEQENLIIKEINDRRIVVAHNSLLKDLDIKRLENTLAYYGNPEQ